MFSLNPMDYIAGHIVPWLKAAALTAWHALLAHSDGFVIVAMVFCLLAIFGSKRAGKAIYWTFAAYIVLQILGMIIG